MANFWDNDPVVDDGFKGPRVTVGAQPQGEWWANDPVVGQQPGLAEDVAKSAGVGLAEGGINVAGTIGDMNQLVGRGSGALFKWLAGDSPTPQQQEAIQAVSQGPLGLLKPTTSADIKAPIERVTGEFYKPQTTAGEYTKTAASFVPGALMAGPSGTLGQLAGNAVKYGVLPGLASEAAGQATEGTAAEPYARAGAAILSGVAAAALSRPSSYGRVVQETMDSLTPQDLARAQALLDDAAAQGVRLSVPEAIQQVTGGGTRLGEVQRVVESTSRGGDRMRAFYADRPKEIAAAGARNFDDLSPQSIMPTEVAPRVQSAAQGEITGVRQAINDAAEPFYAASRQAQVPPAQFQQIAANPTFQEALQIVRNDPVLARSIAGLPDNSIGVIDAVKKQMDDMISAAVEGQNPQRFRGSVLQDDRGAMLQAADAASPDYATARQIGAQGREQMLAPAERAPIGQLAQADTFEAQRRVLFNPNPQPNTQGNIARAVRTVARQDPEAALQLVRDYAEQVFTEATQRLQSGANQAGGAKFAAVLAGNTQQRRNLEAAIRSLPDGNRRWAGFWKFLNVMEATGQRAPQGSATAFNQQIQEALKRGGASEVMSLAASPTAATGFIHKLYQDIRLGRSADALARVFTSGNVDDLATLAKLNPTSVGARQAAARVLIGAYGGGALGSPSVAPAISAPR